MLTKDYGKYIRTEFTSAPCAVDCKPILIKNIQDNQKAGLRRAFPTRMFFLFQKLLIIKLTSRQMTPLESHFNCVNIPTDQIEKVQVGERPHFQ